LGDRQILTIQQQLTTALTDIIAGANPLLNHLGALGISTDDNGKLAVDDSKLTSILSGSKNGVTLDDVRKLFTLSGNSPNAGVQFITGSTKTVASATPYTVHITQAAEKAALTATTALAASTIIDGTNNTFIVGVDGATSATLTLAAGTYTRQTLAQAVQAAINSDATLQGRSVSANLTGDALTITSNRYGNASNVTMSSGAALTALGFTAGASDQGVDVAGSYIVNGVPETAVGNGQFLLGDSGNSNTADLQTRITLTPAQVGSGVDADLTVSRGIASRLDTVLNKLFDPVNGRLKSIDDDFNTSIQDLNDQKAKQNELIQTRQASLEEQFTAMEQTLATLQSTSNFLALQTASLTQKKN
jgi:flagellar hook-associated protein 2